MQQRCVVQKSREESPSVIMVIGNLNIVSMAVFPGETNSIFAIDPNCVLPGPLFVEAVQFVTGRDLEIVELCCCINHLQLPPGDGAYIRRNCTAFAQFPKLSSSFVSERFDQVMIRMLMLPDNHVKHY